MSHRPSLVLSLLVVLGCSSSGGSGGQGVCPSSPPTAGTACFLLSGTSCSYATANGGAPAGYCGGGGGQEAFCQSGTWVYAATPGAGAGYLACPVNAPAQGSSCAQPCGGAQQSCTYDCAHCGGYNCNATCDGATWNVVTNETACQADDAGVQEGGADGATDGGPSESGADARGDATGD